MEDLPANLIPTFLNMRQPGKRWRAQVKNFQGKKKKNLVVQTKQYMPLPHFPNLDFLPWCCLNKATDHCFHPAVRHTLNQSPAHPLPDAVRLSKISQAGHQCAQNFLCNRREQETAHWWERPGRRVHKGDSHRKSATRKKTIVPLHTNYSVLMICNSSQRQFALIPGFLAETLLYSSRLEHFP